MYGSDFCEATCRVANLLLRNILRTTVKDNIVQLLLFLGKLCIVGVVGTSCDHVLLLLCMRRVGREWPTLFFIPSCVTFGTISD